MKVKTSVFLVSLFLTVSVFGDHSEDYKIEIKPAEVIDTIAPLIIDVYTDYNSGDSYELQRQIFYPLIHKKYIVEKKEERPDSLIEIIDEFWCEYPEVQLPYNEYSRIKAKTVNYSYFKIRPAYPTVSEHIIIENDTIRVIGQYSARSFRKNPDIIPGEKEKKPTGVKGISIEKVVESVSKKEKRAPKGILQRIKDFFSR